MEWVGKVKAGAGKAGRALLKGTSGKDPGTGEGLGYITDE